MPNLEPLTSPVRDLWNRATSSTTSATGAIAAAASTSNAPTRPQADIDAAYDHALETLPGTSMAIPAFLARMDPVGAKLDQLQSTMQGPYHLNGTTVYSGAQFRMVGGFNQSAVTARGPARDALVSAAAKARVTSSDLLKLQEGRGDPGALTRVTQALIDGGQLDIDSNRPLADQIHDLQWRFGLGFDCAGYVYKAITAVHGDPAKLGLRPAVDEDFTGLPGNPRFGKMAPADVRAGDVLVLQGHGRGDPGHNLVVYSHSTVGSAQAVTERFPLAGTFLMGKPACRRSRSTRRSAPVPTATPTAECAGICCSTTRSPAPGAPARGPFRPSSSTDGSRTPRPR